VTITIIVGNPRPQSRTTQAAQRVAAAITPDVTPTVIELADLGPTLFDWSDPDVAAAVTACRASDLLILATPTYKATFTGLLKLFLERFDGGTGLAGVVVVPVQLGGSDRHRLAPQVHLKPVLSELGATVPTPALYLLDSQPDGEEERAWLDRWAPVIRRQLETHRSPAGT
jgi:FMN reductase